MAESHLLELARRHGGRLRDIEPVSALVARQCFMVGAAVTRRRDEEVRKHACNTLA